MNIKTLLPLIFIFLLPQTSAARDDLPKMSVINEMKILKKFPLEQVTKIEVFEFYGPPTSKVTGLPHNSEAWTYEKGSKKSFTFVFRGSTVYDIVVRYSGPYKPRTARKKQNKADRMKGNK